MTLREYLQEDGTGRYAQYLVPDLVPPAGAKVELLIVLESPHVDELKTGTPISGGAGRAALKFLLPEGSPPEPLGSFVAQRHAANDFRVAIVNACPVPLQVQAYLASNPSPLLPAADWAVMLAIQGSQKRTISEIRSVNEQDANHLLIPGLQRRISALDLSNTATVFTSGTFAQRSWKEMTSQPPATVLPIPHPSRNLWQKTMTSAYATHLAELRRKEHERNLLALKALFASRTS